MMPCDVYYTETRMAAKVDLVCSNVSPLVFNSLTFVP
jgi:hypothetical protein